MNWCDDNVGTLRFINKPTDLLKFIENYAGFRQCLQKGIKLKFYYIDLMNNNPIDVNQHARHVVRIVYDYDSQRDLPQDFITAKALPVINAPNWMFNPIINFLRVLIEAIKNKLRKEITINQILNAPTIINDYPIKVETFLISIIGQFLYNNPKKIKNDTIEPLNSLGEHLGFDGNKLRQFKIVLITELENYIRNNKKEFKTAFLETIKQQIDTDMMDLEEEPTIFVAYMPIRIRRDLEEIWNL